jgi:hypothetical protein
MILFLVFGIFFSLILEYDVIPVDILLSTKIF